MHRVAIIAVLVAASARAPAAEARGQASLRVRSIDLARRVVVVELGGFPRASAGRSTRELGP